MGKVRTRFLGIDEIEVQQKQEQKERAERKKSESPEENTEEAAQPVEVVSKKKKATVVATGKKRGSKYQKAAAQIESTRAYDISEAVELLKKISYAKFDESVELHLNVLEEGMRGEVSLPHSTGRTVRVAILDDAVLKEIEDGNIAFDILIAHPSQMPKIAKHARILGPKGLMPNPKAGTVSTNPEEAAQKFKSGSIRWKSESKAPIVHQMIGKLSAENTQIVENAQAFILAVGKKNITSAFISASMTPSLKIIVQSE